MSSNENRHPFGLDCFLDTFTDSEINSCIANVIKHATDRKNGGGRT